MGLWHKGVQNECKLAQFKAELTLLGSDKIETFSTV